MINWIVRQLFRWDSLRSELLAEASMYNSITRIMKDPESMKTAAAFWEEQDGWKGWTKSLDQNKYFFNDMPEHSLEDAMYMLDTMEGKND